MNIRKYLAATIIAICASASAQQVNTLYYMQNVQERSDYNPAFQPIHGFYLDLPVLPNFRAGFGNNSLKLNDVLYNQRINGIDSTITFMHPLADKNKFYDKLKKNTKISTGLTFNILNFGFRFKEKNYLTFGINEKIDVRGNLPKDVFKLLLYGTDTIASRSFDFSKLGINATVYTEFSVGYSRELNDKWTIGAKAKDLMGQASV